MGRSPEQNNISKNNKICTSIEIVGFNGLPPLTFEVTSNRKVQIPLYYLKILIFEGLLRNL